MPLTASVLAAVRYIVARTGDKFLVTISRRKMVDGHMGSDACRAALEEHMGITLDPTRTVGVVSVVGVKEGGY